MNLVRLKNRMPTKLNSTTPVSYTHLDVYKRQAFAFSTILRAYSLNSGFSASPKQTAFAAMTCSSAVSYTHLDVYKRQV